jgi:hypothetical protein
MNENWPATTNGNPTQEVELEPEHIVGEAREAAREREDRDAEDHARNDERREHCKRDRRLAAKGRALEQERVHRADPDGEHRHPSRDDNARPDRGQQRAIREKPDATAGRVADEPVEREPPPWRRRIVGVVEREQRDDGERQEQEHEERRYIAGNGIALDGPRGNDGIMSGALRRRNAAR